VVNDPAAADVPPIIVPSIVPPLISAVVIVPKSVQVAPAAVGEPVIVGEVRDLLVKVWMAVKVTTVSEVPGKAKLVPSVPVKVIVFEAVKVFPAAIVKVPVVEEIVKPS